MALSIVAPTSEMTVMNIVKKLLNGCVAEVIHSTIPPLEGRAMESSAVMRPIGSMTKIEARIMTTMENQGPMDWTMGSAP